MVKTRKLTVQERAAIGAFAHKNPCIATLARHFQCTAGAINRWLQEGRKQRPNYSNHPGQGRPRKLSADREAKIRQRAAHLRPTESIRKGLKLPTGVTISGRTARRVVQRGRFEFKWKVVARGKFLSLQNRKSRVRFCKRHPKPDARNWVFLDAKFLYLYRDGNRFVRYCWQRLDQAPMRLPAGTPTVFLFYGAVAHGHKSKLYFVPPTPPLGSSAHKGKENFNSSHFVEMISQLKEELHSWFPGGGYSLLMDHAKQHSSKLSSAAMQSMGLPVMAEFPAKSWDLNVIENVWGMIDGQLLGRKARTNDSWRAHITEAWERISQVSINKLVASMPDRVKMVIANEGAWP